MKIKVSEAKPQQLDWMVSTIVENSRRFPIWIEGKPNSFANYSTDWSQGGPIIERKGIQLARVGDVWEAWVDADGVFCQGPTPLIAAMRCYVTSELGDEVEIPEELT